VDTPRLAFIGCGHHASHNLYPALRFTPARLVAACDLWPERRDLAQRVFGAERVYENHQALLAAENDLDGVIICGPPELHHAAGLEVLRRKLPVFMEKPPGATLEQAEELAAAAAAAGKPCHVGFMKRHARNYRRAYARLGSPDFGRLTHIFLRYSFRVETDPWSTLTLMGTHALDLLRFFAGDPGEVRVMHRRWEKSSNFDVQFAFPGGVTGTLVMNATASAVLERLELTGEYASLHVDELASYTCYPRQLKTWMPPVGEVLTPNFALQTYDNSSGELQGYAGEIAAFVEAVRTGVTPPGAATIADGVAAMHLASRILASS
jgi:myo-inositol 2-dehydrogenase/D-chiro-inositol 1-dehydrogenase